MRMEKAGQARLSKLSLTPFFQTRVSGSVESGGWNAGQEPKIFFLVNILGGIPDVDWVHRSMPDALEAGSPNCVEKFPAVPIVDPKTFGWRLHLYRFSVTGTTYKGYLHVAS